MIVSSRKIFRDFVMLNLIFTKILKSRKQQMELLTKCTENENGILWEE